MKIDIKEKEDLMYVNVELPVINEALRVSPQNREIWCGTSDIIAALEERGIEMSTMTCVKDSHSVHNISDANRKKTWVFAKTQTAIQAVATQEVPSRTAKPSTSTKSTNATTTKKRSNSRKTKK